MKTLRDTNKDRNRWTDINTTDTDINKRGQAQTDTDIDIKKNILTQTQGDRYRHRQLKAQK